jgi:hypothetical protein
LHEAKPCGILFIETTRFIKRSTGRETKALFLLIFRLLSLSSFHGGIFFTLFLVAFSLYLLVKTYKKAERDHLPSIAAPPEKIFFDQEGYLKSL